MRKLRLYLLLATTLVAACGHAGGQAPGSSARLGSPASASRLLWPLPSPPPSPSPPADPRLLSNTSGSFSFRHPPAWRFENCETYGAAMWSGIASPAGCHGESSGYFAIIVMSVVGDQQLAPSQGSYIYIGAVDKTGTTNVDGVEGSRSTARIVSNLPLGPEVGTTQILYDIYNGTRTYFALYQHRPIEPDYSSAFDDMMQHSFRLSAWNGYHSEKWGYTVDYPATWYDLPNLGAPDTEKYFANEKHIGSPIGMDGGGLFFALSTVTGPCRAAPPGDIDHTAQLTVDGQTVTRVSGFLGPQQSEVYWGSYASVPKGDRCFGFAFIFGSKPSRDSNLRISDEIITSFTTS